MGVNQKLHSESSQKFDQICTNHMSNLINTPKIRNIWNRNLFFALLLAVQSKHYHNISCISRAQQHATVPHSKSYQKSILLAGSAVTLRVTESLNKDIQSIADVAYLWSGQTLTRNQTNPDAMGNSSLTVHTKLPISHKAIQCFSMW